MMRSAWIARKRRRRLASIPPQLAQDLEVIASALRAGASFLQAIQVASQEGSGPLAEEWALLLQEIQLGASLSQALTHFETRCPLAPIKTVVVLVTIIQRTGGNLAESLSNVADALRQEILFQGKVRAMTAQGKLSGYVVAAMPFLIMASLGWLAPELMRPLYQTAVGWVMLGGIIVLIVIGTLLIEKIVTIEV